MNSMISCYYLSPRYLVLLPEFGNVLHIFNTLDLGYRYLNFEKSALKENCLENKSKGIF
jgi:hypothetical protein